MTLFHARDKIRAARFSRRVPSPVSECRHCNGTGRVTDRGRFYGDRSTNRTCPDCFDAAEAQRELDDAMRREATARAWADDHMESHNDRSG